MEEDTFLSQAPGNEANLNQMDSSPQNFASEESDEVVQGQRLFMVAVTGSRVEQ